MVNPPESLDGIEPNGTNVCALRVEVEVAVIGQPIKHIL